jgi:hypothetical protein
MTGSAARHAASAVYRRRGADKSRLCARANFSIEHGLRARINRLDETLRSFRSVERAKNILMEKRKLDDEEAYHFMRRQAMSPTYFYRRGGSCCY